MNYWKCAKHLDGELWEWAEGEPCSFCSEREAECRAIVTILKLDKMIEGSPFLDRVVQLIETRMEQSWVQDHK